MTTKYTVYTINLGSEVKYVGVTTDFKRRKRQHLYRKQSSAIPTDIDLSDLSFVSVFLCDNKKEAYQKEGELILKYDTINDGWNKCRSGFIECGRDKDYFSEYHQENIDIRRKRSKEWYDTHKEHHKQCVRKYYYDHLEEQRKYQREYKRAQRQNIQKKPPITR